LGCCMPSVVLARHRRTAFVERNFLSEVPLLPLCFEASLAICAHRIQRDGSTGSSLRQHTTLGCAAMLKLAAINAS
jgi:hypothetical protein